MCSNHQSLAELIHLTVVSRSDLDRKWTSRQWKYYSCFLLAVSVLFINHERSCFTFHVLMVVVKFCYINCLKGEINCKIYIYAIFCVRERGGGKLKPVSQKDTKDWRGFHAVEYYTTVSVNIFYTPFTIFIYITIFSTKLLTKYK